ncbi:MAG: hypothetical protein ACUVXI_13940 [bacterium]
MEQVMQVDTKAIAEKGQKIYEERLKGKLEPEHKGEIVTIEVGTGNYFLGDSVIEAVNRAKEKHPDKIFFIARVGYKAVHVRR